MLLFYPLIPCLKSLLSVKGPGEKSVKNLEKWPFYDQKVAILPQKVANLPHFRTTKPFSSKGVPALGPLLTTFDPFLHHTRVLEATFYGRKQSILPQKVYFFDPFLTTTAISGNSKKIRGRQPGLEAKFNTFPSGPIVPIFLYYNVRRVVVAVRC